VFEFCENLLDRIEVGTVGRQEDHVGSGSADGGADCPTLVAAEVVEDDDIARSQGRNENLFDIGEEAGSVDRAVEDARRDNPIGAQSGEEGQGFPMAVGNARREPPPFRAPTAQRRHVRLGPGLVDEDKARRIDPALMTLPPRAAAGDVRPILFGRQNAFF
jgi:hypothetical protein